MACSLVLANPTAAELHLMQACSVMATLIDTHGRCSIEARAFDPFPTLARSILGQQLSARAAETIERRVLGVIGKFEPASVRDVSFEELRGAGLSGAKTRYIIELADRVLDGRLDLEALRDKSDDLVISALTELPGIGRWTAEMFLIFGLKRPDVLALGDVGLQRANRQLFGVDVQLATSSQAWQPFRSTASWYLWRHLDAPLEAK